MMEIKKVEEVKTLRNIKVEVTMNAEELVFIATTLGGSQYQELKKAIKSSKRLKDEYKIDLINTLSPISYDMYEDMSSFLENIGAYKKVYE